jgi:adenylate cyclase
LGQDLLTQRDSGVGPETAERKLAAILSADVVGYSRLMAEDEDGTVRRLTDYREEIAMLVRQHRGRVVDSPGDNLLAEFPAATDAVSCAVEVQGSLKVRNAPLPEDRRMEFRIGVHLGEVRVEDERIYGDGVNIAARLEGLAEPGGICISGMVHSQVRNKLDVGYEDLGEQEIKNIPEPVRVYRIRLEPKEVSVAGSLPGMDELTVPGFSGQPAIAVLPFDNLSGDPEQEYFADGIAEDLITRLSSWRWFPVIARNSSFVYKGKAVDVKQVSRELGVRYVVEGSVRKAGDWVRISAQLVDATTGRHVWATRYDRELRDIFVLQDEITDAIAGWLEPELAQFERKRAVSTEPRDLNAWDCANRGWWHHYQFTKDNNAKARSWFEKAIEIDPHFSWAFYGVVATHYWDILLNWTTSLDRSISEVVRAGRMSVALDDRSPYSQLALGAAYTLTGPQNKMLAALESAIELNPSLGLAYGILGNFLSAVAGRADDAIANLDKAIRLSPKDQLLFAFFSGKAFAHLATGRYDEAVEWAQRSLQHRPDWADAYMALAASYAHLGQLDEASRTSEELLRVHPEFSLAAYRLVYAALDPDLTEHIFDGLRKAGLKE